MGKLKEQQIDPVDPQTGEMAPEVATQKHLPATVAPPLGATTKLPRPSNVLPETGFAKLAGAIAQITSEVAENPIHKAGKNAFHNYSYARMQDILGGLTPLMSKHGVVVMQTEVERGFMDNGNAIFATYDFTILHKSGEVWPFPQRQTGVSNTRTSKGTFDDKGLNKCHTSARKYFLLSLFQIPTTDEDDGDRGDNDRGDYDRKPIPPAQRPAQQETAQAQTRQKLAPTEIPRPAGIKAVDWGRAYIEAMKGCDSIAEIQAWVTANAKPLEDLMKMAPAVYARVETVENEMREELGARS